jgi:hypothetical protein
MLLAAPTRYRSPASGEALTWNVLELCETKRSITVLTDRQKQNAALSVPPSPLQGGCGAKAAGGAARRNAGGGSTT